MADGVKRCPECSSNLGSDYRGTLIVWECPKGHGTGINIFDAVGYLQRDEIDGIWSGAAGAPLSELPSPINGKPMVCVKFLADDDTDYDNVGSNAQMMEVELDVENYFAWFQVSELDSMPTMKDVAVPKTSAGMVGLGDLEEGESKFDHIFDDAENYAMDEQPSGSPLGRLARRLSRR